MRTARAIVALGAIGLITSSLTAPVQASTYTPDYTCRIPFLERGTSATVSNTGVTVTATTNSAVQGDTANTYLYRSRYEIQTVFTFDPPVPGIRMQTRRHADAPGGFERFNFTGVGGDFTANVENQDTTVTYETDNSPFTGRMSQLTVDYRFDTPVADFARGSYLDLYISCVRLTPSTQTVTGQAGTALASTAYSLTGFLGTPTYQVTSGTLPAGLTLNTSTGVITGTPTAAASGTVTITATGATFGSSTAAVTFDIDPDPNPSPSPTPAPPGPPPPEPEPTPTPTPTATPIATPTATPTTSNLDPITQEQNPRVPVGGVPLGGSVLLVDGQPAPVIVRPDAPRNPTGLDVEGPGFTMRLVGRTTNDRPLGLTPDGALILEQDRTAFTQGTGFQTNSQVFLYLLSAPRFLGTVATDATGAFQGSVPLPLDIPAGRHTLQANGFTPDGVVRSLSLGVQVIPNSSAQARLGKANATVFFAPLSAALDSTARRALDALVKGRKASIQRVVVDGYVQASDTTLNDLPLSRARANAVADYLKSIGVSGATVTRARGIAPESGSAARKAVTTITYRK